MNILGLTYPYNYNPSACILVDGHISGLIEEERLVRIKHAPRLLPRLSSEWVLKAAGLTWEGVDAVAIPCVPLHTILRRNLHDSRSLAHGVCVAGYLGCHTAFNDIRLKQFLRDYSGSVFRVSHHLSHAASAYYAAGFERANIISLDGTGGENSGVLAYGENGKIKILHEFSNEDSLGYVYMKVTEALGFRPHSDEYKVMGLASYGKPDQSGLSFLDISGELPQVNPFELNRMCRRWKRSFFQKNPLAPESMNLAATLQISLEKAVTQIVDYLFRRTGCPYFCFAGGIALNCSMNRRLLELPQVQKLYVQPLSLDSGISLGAAYLVHEQLTGKEPELGIESLYTGPEYSRATIKKAIEKTGLNDLKVSNNVTADAAQILAEGKIIGWFQGRMEAGPRALGNRSILADPRRIENRDRVNEKIKHRETWRPFALSILQEEAPKYIKALNGTGSYPHMTITCEVLRDHKDDVQAGVHVDGTTRPQTVKKSDNPLFWDLISKFKELTGVPAVLNTSFNRNHEPIVCSPDDAVKCFLGSGLDYLVMGDFILGK